MIMAEEILDQIDISEHEHVVSDTDKTFTIDPFTRKIIADSGQKTTIIQGDHKSEIFTFTVPRYIEGHDMAACNKIYIPYLNTEVEGRNPKFKSGVYTVSNITVNKDTVVFTWEITINSTLIEGALHFMILMSCMEGKLVEYRWNTDYYEDVIVKKSLYSELNFENEYLDVIEQWKETVKQIFKEYIDSEVDSHIAVVRAEALVELHGKIDTYFDEKSEYLQNNIDTFDQILRKEIMDMDEAIESFDSILETEIAKMSAELKTQKSRMDTFTSLKEGSTTGDAELSDIRVDFEGNTHGSAGAAVREQAKKLNYGLSAVEQKNLAVNPFQPLLVDAYCYYKGSDIGKYPDALYIPQYNITNFKEYKLLENDGVTTSYCMGARLLTPIPAFNEPNGEYVVVIKTDVAMSGYLYFGHQFNWAPTNTNWNWLYDLKVGYNVIRVKGGTIRDSGHTDYRYVFFKTNKVDFVELGVKTFEMYVIRGESLIGYIDDTADRVSNNANFSWNAQNALNSSNAGAVRLPIDEYMSNIEKTPDSGMYALEETTTGYRFVISEEHHIKENTNKWFQAFVTNLGKKSEAIKKTIMFKIVSNNESCTKQALSRLVLHNTIYNWNGVSINQGVIKVSEVNLSAYSDDDDIYLIWGIAAGEDGASEWNETTCDMTTTILELSDGYVLADELKDFDPNNYFTKTESIEKFGPPVKNIICWGDSLTAMGGWTNKLAALSGMNVINCGTGGENSNVIASRQGADCIIINNFTIPAGTEPVKIADYVNRFKTYMGEISAPLLQGGSQHVNPVMLGDVEGILAWTGSAYNDTSGIWTFARTVPGEEVVINRPTHLTTYADRTYNDGNNIHIFFVGTNDGAFNVDNMINKIRLMIDRSNTNEYLILGLTRILSPGYKDKFRTAFGRKWLDLHGYLVSYGLEDSGIDATKDDCDAIESDLVPPSLLMDAVHYTNKTRELIGIQVYNRLRDLHYIS